MIQYIISQQTKPNLLRHFNSDFLKKSMSDEKKEEKTDKKNRYKWVRADLNGYIKGVFTCHHQGYVLAFKIDENDENDCDILNTILNDLDNANVSYMIRIVDEFTFIICYISQNKCQTWAEQHSGVEVSVSNNIINQYCTNKSKYHDTYLKRSNGNFYVHIPFSATKNIEYNGNLFKKRTYKYETMNDSKRECILSNAHYLRYIYYTDILGQYYICT